MKKRPYRMKKRAEMEKQTRRRITESAVQLHGTLGPSRTSIWSIAEHAGVRRSTVYRHFADEAALFAACTSHWISANPFPDLARWRAIDNVNQRLRIALREIYAFYRRTERMMINILRDEEAMPIVKKMLGGYRAYLAAARGTLLQGRKLGNPARRRVQATLGHALAFQVWHSLAVEQGLGDTESSELMCRLVAAASK